MTDRYTFPDSLPGLLLALQTTLSQRRHGYKTRLETTLYKRFILQTVVAVPPVRPNRRDRGCLV